MLLKYKIKDDERIMSTYLCTKEGENRIDIIVDGWTLFSFEGEIDFVCMDKKGEE